MWPVIMAAFCYLVWPCLPLAWYNLAHRVIDHRVSLITSIADHPKKTKSQISVHVSRKESEVSTVSNCKGMVPKLITSKGQIAKYSDVFDGIQCFPVPPYHIQVTPSVMPKQTPCQPVPVHLKEFFKKEIDKMLQAGVLKLFTKLHLGSTFCLSGGEW